MSAKKIWTTIWVVWTIISIVYVVWDVWSDFKATALQNAYQSGQTQMIDDIFGQIEADACQQPITLVRPDSQVQLIDVSCLQTPEAPSE